MIAGALTVYFAHFVFSSSWTKKTIILPVSIPALESHGMMGRYSIHELDLQ